MRLICRESEPNNLSIDDIQQEYNVNDSIMRRFRCVTRHCYGLMHIIHSSSSLIPLGNPHDEYLQQKVGWVEDMIRLGTEYANHVGAKGKLSIYKFYFDIFVEAIHILDDLYKHNHHALVKEGYNSEVKLWKNRYGGNGSTNEWTNKVLLYHTLRNIVCA